MPRTPSTTTSTSRPRPYTTPASHPRPCTTPTKSALKAQAEAWVRRVYAHDANCVTKSLEPIPHAGLKYPCAKCGKELDWSVVVGSMLDVCLNGQVGMFCAWVRHSFCRLFFRFLIIYFFFRLSARTTISQFSMG
jgi:hypothetical protein